MKDKKLVSLALRLPPKVMEVAESLVKVRAITWTKDDENSRTLVFSNINDAINVLIREGMATVEVLIDNDLKDNCQPMLDRHHLMMQFLMQNPTATHVRPENLPKDSEVRVWLAEAMQQWNPDEGSSNLAASRAWVIEEYDQVQQLAQDLTAAKNAIQLAVMQV